MSYHDNFQSKNSKNIPQFVSSYQIQPNQQNRVATWNWWWKLQRVTSALLKSITGVTLTNKLSFNINWIEIAFVIFEILAYYISFGVLKIFLHIWIEQSRLIQIWQPERKISSKIQKKRMAAREIKNGLAKRS